MGWLNRNKADPEQELYADPANASGIDRYTYQASHMRLTRMMRIVAFCFVISGTLNLLQGALNFKLLEQYQIFPVFITEKGLINEHVQILPAAEDVEGYELAREKFARRQVENYLTIDPITLNRRLYEAGHSTEKKFFERIKEEQIKSKKVDKMTLDGVKRHIYIDTAHLLDESDTDFVYVVDFDQEDVSEGAVIDTRPVRAFLKISTLKRKVRLEDRLTNPLGFTVMDMSLKVRKKDES